MLEGNLPLTARGTFLTTTPRPLWMMTVVGQAPARASLPHAHPPPTALGNRSDMTPLDKPLKCALDIEGKAYTLAIDPEGMKLAPKGHRNGVELRWKDLVSGDAGLAAALQASVRR